MAPGKHSMSRFAKPGIELDQHPACAQASGPGRGVWELAYAMRAHCVAALRRIPE